MTYSDNFKKMLSADYIEGPGMVRYDIKKEVDKTYTKGNNAHSNFHNLENNKLIIPYTGAEKKFVSSKLAQNFNTIVGLAELCYELEKQVSSGFSLVGNELVDSSEAFAIYLKNDFILKDIEGKNYISLTEKGVKLFREYILGADSNFVSKNNNLVSLEKLPKGGKNMVLQDGIASLLEEKHPKTSYPSVNSGESIGLTAEYHAPDSTWKGK